LDKLPPINELKQSEQTLIIFDDMVLDVKNHSTIQKFYVRGRKRGVSVMFLSQYYYGTPKIIRQNINYCVILKLGGTRDVNSILRECSIGLTKDELLYMYQQATKKKFDVLTINLDKSSNERYRHIFLNYYTVE